jgi:serine/threonine-protein kinase
VVTPSSTGAVQDPFGLVATVLAGNYRVDAVVGEGGFGVVYRGVHLSLGQPIAIKVLKGLDGEDPRINELVQEKFRLEARLLYTLSQSSLHIVRALDFGAATTPSGIWAPFIVLEWLEGRSLSDDLDERQARGFRGRSVTDALALLEPVAEGLAEAHRQNVAHRDLKPANVFLIDPRSSGPRVGAKVLDFGVAKIMKEGEAAGTKGTFASFTWFYAAPEQLDPRIGETGPWTDVYAFALVLTELLTDKKPVEEANVIGIMKAAMDPARRPTPRQRGANVPDELDAVCLRALAVDPRERYASLGEFWAALVAARRDSRDVMTLKPPATAIHRPSTPRVSPYGPPLGTPPPGAVPPYVSPHVPYTSDPRATPPPFVPWGPSPPLGTAPPGRSLDRPGAQSDRTSSLVPITIVLVVLAVLFAGSCALIHSACSMIR